MNTLGKVPINTPAYTVSLWSVFKINPQWRVGAGLEAVGQPHQETAPLALGLARDERRALEEESHGGRRMRLRLPAGDAARGPLVHEAALIDALRRKTIGSAGLDKSPCKSQFPRAAAAESRFRSQPSFPARH